MSNQLELLKKKLFENLSHYPLMEVVYKRQLENRVNGKSWLENDLIYVILKEGENINIIEDYLNNINLYNNKLIGDFSRNDKGSEKGYDKQILDTWSEINALDYLIKKGYRKLAKITETTERTPDFKDEDNNLFEVKNLRTPDEIDTLIMKKIETMELLNPKRYKRKLLSLLVPYNMASIYKVKSVDLKNIDEFVEKIDHAIDNEEFCITHNYINIDEEVVNFKCEVKESESFCVFRMPNSRGINLIDEARIDSLIDHHLNKIVKTSDEAFRQLLEFNKTNAKMYVLLNWQKPSVFQWDDSLQNHTDNFISNYNKYVKSTNPKINIILINNSNDNKKR